MANFNDILNVVNGSIDGTNISSTAALSIASITTSGNGVIGGTLAVTGTQTLTGATTCSASLSVGTTLAVTGATTLTGALTSNGLTTVKQTKNTVTAYTPDAAGTATLNLTTGNIHHITMPAGNITIAISNETAGQCFLIEILQDGTGSRTVTWFSGISWAGGSAPTLTTTASKTDCVGFRVTGTDTYIGYVVGQNI